MEFQITLSDILSVLAIIVSFVTLKLQYNTERKLKRKENIREFYNQVYKDILLDELPVAISRITWTRNGIKGTDEARDVLIKLRKKSIVFRFLDYLFYSDVNNRIMDLEDFVLDLDNYNFTKELFEQKNEQLVRKLKELYDTIMDRCIMF